MRRVSVVVYVRLLDFSKSICGSATAQSKLYIKIVPRRKTVYSVIFILTLESGKYCCWSLKENTKLVTLCSKSYPSVLTSSFSANPLKTIEIKINAHNCSFWLLRFLFYTLWSLSCFPNWKHRNYRRHQQRWSSQQSFGPDLISVLFSLCDATDFCLFFLKHCFPHLSQNNLNSYTFFANGWIGDLFWFFASTKIRNFVLFLLRCGFLCLSPLLSHCSMSGREVLYLLPRFH